MNYGFYGSLTGMTSRRRIGAGERGNREGDRLHGVSAARSFLRATEGAFSRRA